jgi:hypothetical protein
MREIIMFEEEIDQKTYQLFISQVSETDEEYEKFKERLDDAHYFKYQNHSQNNVSGKSNKDELKKLLKDPLNDSEILIILSGLYPTYQNILMALVELAHDLEIPILVIRPHGEENVPQKLEDKSNGVIGWSPSCIAGAIKGVLSGEDDDLCEL